MTVNLTVLYTHITQFIASNQWNVLISLLFPSSEILKIVGDFNFTIFMQSVFFSCLFVCLSICFSWFLDFDKDEIMYMSESKIWPYQSAVGRFRHTHTQKSETNQMEQTTNISIHFSDIFRFAVDIENADRLCSENQMRNKNTAIEMPLWCFCTHLTSHENYCVSYSNQCVKSKLRSDQVILIHCSVLFLVWLWWFPAEQVILLHCFVKNLYDC